MVGCIHFFSLAESVCLPSGWGGVEWGVWGLGVAPLEVCRPVMPAASYELRAAGYEPIAPLTAPLGHVLASLISPHYVGYICVGGVGGVISLALLRIVHSLTNSPVAICAVFHCCFWLTEPKKR